MSIKADDLEDDLNAAWIEAVQDAHTLLGYEDWKKRQLKEFKVDVIEIVSRKRQVEVYAYFPKEAEAKAYDMAEAGEVGFESSKSDTLYEVYAKTPI